MHQLAPIEFDGPATNRRRPILPGLAVCLPRRLQAATTRDIVHRPTEEWPRAAKKELDLIYEHLRQQEWGFGPDAGPSGPPSGRHFEPARTRSKPDGLSSMWQGLIDAIPTRTGQEVECSEAGRGNHNFPSTNNVPGRVHKANHQGWQAEPDGKRRRTGSGPQGQRDPDRGSEMAELVLEPGSQGPTAEPEDSSDVRRCMSDSPSDPSVGRKPQFGAEICSSTPLVSRQSAARRRHCHTMEAGREPQGPRSSGTTYAPAQVGRQRRYTTHPYEDEANHVAEIATGGCNLPQIAQVLRGITTTSLINLGSTCYLNNTLLAQVWTTLLTTPLELDTWGAWTQSILCMFTTHAGEAHNPCQASILGSMLTECFTSHAMTAQHDAGEFASWMRAQMFEKKLMPDGYLTTHAWDSRLFTTTEDSGSLIAPIVLRDLPEVQTPLQEVIQQWHHHGPWLNGLRTASSWVCLQLERHPRLHHRHRQAITWDRNRIQLPVFDGYNHCSITWTEYQIMAGVLHIGSSPVEGHYQAVLFNSGAGLLCDDSCRPRRLTRDRSFYENIYLIWAAPMATLCPEYRRPLPWPPTDNIGNLIFEHLG